MTLSTAGIRRSFGRTASSDSRCVRWRHSVPGTLRSLTMASGLFLAFLPAGCTGTPMDPPLDPISIAFEGRTERGGVITLRAEAAGVTLAPELVAWTVSPASAAEIDSVGVATLLAAGPIVVTAEADGERTATLSIDIAIPPTVVFDRLTDGNRDIWRVALDGGELTRLTTHAADDSDPSAVGDHIVFVSYRDGNAELYATTLEGGVERRLTTRGSADLSPALSPGGDRVAFTNNGSGVSKVWTMPFAGGAGAVTMPGRTSATDIHASPDWHPAGGILAFVSTLPGSADILAVALPDVTIEPLVTGSRAEVEPAWSPDGDRVAFVSNRDGDTELYLLTLSSGEIVRLTNRPGGDSQPAWLPDGRIVYTSTEGGSTRLRWLDPDAPEEVHDVPTGGTGASHPSGVL